MSGTKYGAYFGIFNIQGYGAKIDGQFVADGAMVSPTAVLTSVSGKFVAGDVGKLITVAGAGAAGVTLYTTILSFQSTTQVTLAAANASGGSVSAKNVFWGTDDLAAINLARNAAQAVGGVVYCPAVNNGICMVSGQITMSPAASATVDVLVASLISDSIPGRIGDVVTDLSGFSIVPAGAFASGTLVLDYVSLNNTTSLNGGQVRGISFICQGVAAGVRISNVRRFRCSDLNIDHANTPTLGGSVTGAFNVLQQNATASAYSIYDNINTSYSAKDGIVHNAKADDIFSNCYDLNAANIAYNCSGSARWIACHYEVSAIGWQISGGNGTNICVACEYFGQPTSNVVQLTSAASAVNPVTFIGCWFSNAPGAAPGEVGGSIVRVMDSGFAVLAQFVGCFFRASANTSDFVYVDPAVRAGSQVKFQNCNFGGVVTTNKFNDASGQSVLGFDHSTGIITTYDGVIPSASGYSIQNNANTFSNWLVLNTGALAGRGPISVPPSLAGTVAATSYGTIPVKIAENRVSVGGSITQITFGSLPSGFRHLLLEWYCRTDAAVVTATLTLRFNAVSTNTYDFEFINADAAVVTATEALTQSAIQIANMPGASATANYFAAGEAKIKYYGGAVGNKLVVADNVYATSDLTTKQFRESYMGKWRTAGTAITEVDVINNNGFFVIDSLFTLWGIP